MPKMRVHEIAKQLNQTSKNIIAKLQEFGVDVKNHMSNIDETDSTRLMEFYKSKQTPPAAKSEAPKANEPSNSEPVHTPVQNQNGVKQEGQRRDGQNQRYDRPRRDGQRRDGRDGQYPRQNGQRRDNQPGTGQNNQRRDNQSGAGQNFQRRENGQTPGGQAAAGQNAARRDNQRRPDGQRPDGQRRDYQPRPDGQRRDYQPRPDGQRRDYQPRPDGQNRDSQPRQDGQRRDYQPRPDGQRRDYQPRPDGQRRDNQPRPDGQRRDNQPRPDGQRRDNQYSGGQRPYTNTRRDSYPNQSGARTNAPGAGTNAPGAGANAPGATGAGANAPGATGAAGGQRRDYRSGPGTGRPRPDFQNRGGFVKKDDGRPPFPKRDGAKPPLGKKDDKKVEQPSKDDRKQLFQKDAQMRAEKTKTKSETEKKEGRQPFGRRDNRQRGGPNRRGAVQKTQPKPAPPDVKLIKIPLVLTVKELAEKLRRSGADVVKELMKVGVMATVNQEIDFAAATKVGESLNVLVEEALEVDLFEQAFAKKSEADENRVERPPIVVVMGHVDHGKTSLLDAIRHARVTETEAGGITQHIGAYTVAIEGKSITFLDTPGHEAFTAMRMRGAQVTDIAVLVVAADDGVMPQTIEAINHAKAAGVDVIVAINKIDKPNANPDRVKQELTEHGLLVEDWGGDVISVEVSALRKTGIDHLLEMITIVAEMKELRANPDKPARGTIVEAQLDKGRGPVATVLVQDGSLNVGDTVVAGACFGRIRAMLDDKGQKVKTATPSMPVEILGLADVPAAGDMFYVAQNDKQARMLSDSVIAKSRVNMIKAMPQKVSLDDLFDQIKAGNVKDLNVVVKADVQGSAEALRTSLEKISNEEVRVQIIHSAVGAITESDVMLASASNAVIIGFNVRPEANAKSVADAEGVDIRLYRVIYNAIEDITAAMKGLLAPVYKEKVIGHAEIRQIFKASGVGTIGGSYVTDGKITRNAQIRIIRDGKVVYDGHLETLRRFKDDVKEVNSGFECGLLFTKFNDIKENDVAEAFIMEEIER